MRQAMPVCGFCASRRVLCRYYISAPKSKNWQAYIPGRDFPHLQSQSPPSVSLQAIPTTRQLPFPTTQLYHTPFHHSSLYVSLQSIEESVIQLAQNVSELTKLTYDNITHRFFQAFHIWLPGVTPDSFRHEASR